MRTPRRARRLDRGSVGFTLVEVLVALTIVAIALLAALRAVTQSTNAAAELRARMMAGWVAEDVLALQRARGEWLAPGIQRGAQRQGGIDFAWREEVIATPNAAFRRVDLFVFAPAEESHTLARLTGFLVQPPAGSAR